MKKTIIRCFSIICAVFFLSATVQNAQAQLTVVQGTGLSMTPTQLVQQVLVGGGVSISNATFNGSGASISSTMIGRFQTAGTATTQLGFTGGIIIASGNANGAIGPNSSGSNGAMMATGSDPDLQLLLPSYTIYDKAVLEFDFVPISDTIKFRYVFGSEEFDEFCNSSFNDVFGFFVSGPGITGPFSLNSINIALMPNIPTNYVTIDNVCSAGAAYSWLNPTGSANFQYDRLTNVYTAWCLVQPCEQYHIKLAVADAGDQSYDSGVFLEANSFSTNGISYNTSYSSNIDTVAVEGCNNAIINFSLSQPAVDTVIIHYTISGDAIEGTDYPAVPDSLVILPGQDSVGFTIIPISDSIPESTEIVYISYVNTVCGTLDTITILIKDYTPISATVTPDVHSCNGQSATLNVNASGGYSPLTYQWSDSLGTGTSVTVNPPTPQYYYITTSDACNFSRTDSIKVSISNLASAITNIDSITCYGYSDATATVTGSNGLTPYHYNWSTTGDTTAMTDNLGVGSYTVTMTDDIGCTSTASVTIVSPPLIGLILTPTNETCFMSCNGSIGTSITGPYELPVSYSWSTNPYQIDPTAISLCPGDYTVTVTYSVHNCKLVQTANISTNAIIDATFTTNPNPPEGYVPVTIIFNSSGTTGAVSYLWDFGDGTTSTDPNPSHDYPDMGNYVVILTASSGPPNNCLSTYQVTVVVIQPSSMLIPNVFTPNDDGINDKFVIETEGIATININIFNRWGKNVYNFKGNDFSVVKQKTDVWDGTSKTDGKCADGTYYYVIDAIGYDKKEYNLQGTITLIR
ncbi:MAG: choice-of-anchor L domain-containing protein [Bacteroidota bacterium]